VDILSQIMHDREARQAAQVDADERWLRESAGIDPAERLLQWDRWVLGQLATLGLPEGGKDRLLRQCAAEITTVAKQLRGRGWLLDGVELATHVRALLAPIAKALKAGKVADFWPYFRHSVKVYVGANAEQIQALARRSGGDECTQSVGAALAALGIGQSGRIRGASMTELLATRAGEISTEKAESLRTRTARARARHAACKADADQPKLF
jgi:hypothetical protein